MRTYLITYDLTKPEDSKDYLTLISYIKSAFALWAKPEKSVWLVKSSLDISSVRTNLRQKMDANDKLLVIDITSANWATYNISNEVTQWMQNNL